MTKSFNVANCDLCGKEVEFTKINDKWMLRDSGEIIEPWRHILISVVFTTEMNEGTGCEPYLDNVYVDVCPECHKRLVDEMPVIACGAQGYNHFSWSER